MCLLLRSVESTVKDVIRRSFENMEREMELEPTASSLGMPVPIEKNGICVHGGIQAVENHGVCGLTGL